MTKDLPFLNNQWLWPIILIGLFIWLVFIWKDKSKYNSTKFFINIFVSLIAIIALVLIALKPLKYSSGKPLKAAILSNGYNQDQLDSLKLVYNDLVIFNYTTNNPLFINTETPESIFLLGDGIASFDLWQLDSIKVTYLKGHEPNGVINLNYDTKNRVGNKAIFKGRYLNASQGHKLMLESPNGRVIDSLVLLSEKIQEFELSANLKIQGNFLYHLIEKDKFNTIIAKNPLPITILKENQLSVLIINNFPTFETKYLKNYLSKQGHQVLIRSQLTKDRYKYEYFNMKNRSTVSFNQKNLNAFDLMIIDATSLNKLSKASRNSIKKSVIENGLGVYIQPDNSFLNSNNRLVSFNFQRNKSTTTTLKEWPRINITTYPFKFKPEFALQPIQSSSLKTISAYKRLGFGRVGTSLVKNSYHLVLNGHQEVYQQLWSKTLESMCKKETPIADWDTSSLLAFKNEPFDFVLRSQINQPNVTSDKGAKIPVKQNVDIMSSWKGITYPKNSGWHTLKVQQDSSSILNYYVTDSSKWKSLRAYKSIKANERYFDNHKVIKKNIEGPNTPINPIWFYCVFMLCVGYLWLEPKL